MFPGRDIVGAQRRGPPQPRQQHHQVRPRRGADDRPDQPLQHDVRPVLHGRQPGRLRPRADAGKKSRRCSTTPSRSSRAGRCRCSSRAASRRCRRTSSTPSGTPARSATTPCRRPPTASSSPRSPEFAKAAAEAGLRYAYLQFDGIGNAANSHRLVGNLFDVKLRAIENLWSAGVDIVPVITIVNGINNEQVGRIIQFALDNPRKISFLRFQPVSFTGRDEEVTDERRAAQRYTLSPPRARREEPDGPRRADARLVPDLVHGHVHRLGRPRARARRRELGQLNCGCHPNCGIGMARDGRQGNEGSRARSPQFLNGDRLAKDVARVNDAGPRQVPVRRRHGAGADAQLRPVPVADAPQDDRPAEEVRQDLRRHRHATTARSAATAPMPDIEKRRGDRWNFLFIAGMWFQDLFNYDFRRTEQCIIPYATQEGEISFCAYNTGIGWRNIVEKMHMTATLTKWYEEHGRHEIFAGGKKVGARHHRAHAGARRRRRRRRTARRTSTTRASPRPRAKRSCARATKRRSAPRTSA